MIHTFELKIQIPHEEYEDFIRENLRPTYWNEYLGEEIVFIFKMDNGSIKRIVRDELNDDEILDLCRKFAGVDFEDVDTMLENIKNDEIKIQTYEKLCQMLEKRFENVKFYTNHHFPVKKI